MKTSSERELHEFQQLLNVRDPRALHVYSEYQRTNNDAYFHAAVRSIVSSSTPQPPTEVAIQAGQIPPPNLESAESTTAGNDDLSIGQQIYHPHHQMPPGYDLNMMNSHFQGLRMGKILFDLLRFQTNTSL